MTSSISSGSSLAKWDGMYMAGFSSCRVGQAARVQPEYSVLRMRSGIFAVVTRRRHRGGCSFGVMVTHARQALARRSGSRGRPQRRAHEGAGALEEQPSGSRSPAPWSARLPSCAHAAISDGSVEIFAAPLRAQRFVDAEALEEQLDPRARSLTILRRLSIRLLPLRSGSSSVRVVQHLHEAGLVAARRQRGRRRAVPGWTAGRNGEASTKAR